MNSKSEPKTKRWRKRLYLVLVATLCSLLLAEGGLRLAAFCLNKERGIVYHPDFGWGMVPGVQKTGFMWGGDQLSRINAQGWRDDDFQHEPAHGKLRLAVVGDSFTFGVGLNFGERFSELLETKQPGLEVLNFGMNASGTDQHLRMVEESVLAYQPKVIVLTTYMGNDLEGIRFEAKGAWPKPYYRLVQGELELVRPQPNFSMWLRTTFYLGELVFQMSDHMSRTPVRAAEWQTADRVPLYLALLESMQSRAAAAGARLLVVLGYPRGQKSDQQTAEQQRIVEGLEQRGVQVLDTLSTALHAEGSAGLYLPDGHWNPAGNVLVADLILQRLQSLGWLVK